MEKWKSLLWLYSYRIKKDNTISDYTIIIIIKHAYMLYNNKNKYNNNRGFRLQNYSQREYDDLESFYDNI